MQGGEFRCESTLLFSLIGLAMLALHFAACWQVNKGHFTGRPTLPATFYISELKDCNKTKLVLIGRVDQGLKDCTGRYWAVVLDGLRWF